MDLSDRLKNLEENHDWYGVVETLEKAIEGTNDSQELAGLHLRLGRVLNERFLQGVKALKHFQDAFKLNPALVEALVEAGDIYWEIGKLNMVQKLLELQIRNSNGAVSAGTWLKLGDVYSDLGDLERASSAYAQCLQSGGRQLGADEKLHDAQTSDSEWQERVAGALRAAHEATEPREKAEHFTRAARLAQRFAPDEVEELLTRAYSADPTALAPAALFEGMMVEAQRADAILEAQNAAVAEASSDADRAQLAFRFGARWALRHQNPDVAETFIQRTLELDPSNEVAFAYLREKWGTAEGKWIDVVRLADTLADRLGRVPAAAFFLSQAALIAWSEIGDLERARGYFERLAQVAPEHTAVKSFEARTGESISGSAGQKTKGNEEVVSEDSTTDAQDAAEAAPEPNSGGGATEQEQGDDAQADEADEAPADEGLIADLREKLEAQRAANRHHEYVKTLVALAGELPRSEEKLDLYLEAADLYVNKFMNQAEAVRTYEKVLEMEPTNAAALDYLRQMYEKRRDWEKLIALKTSEAEAFEGPERVMLFKEIAQLATERVKKPDVCIGLWAVVLENDPDDFDALKALSQLYERARDYQNLADILEKVAEGTDDIGEKVQVLTKLGQITGDRLKDDARAAAAYRLLLTLQPDDRRAQEQLKKRYVALGMWDELEMFYAETGKWDEFIRVLESNESRTESIEQRIGMLMKIAELWITQKGKPERAARAYEKILTLDENNLDAAERLIPLYTDGRNSKGLANAIEVKLAHVTEAIERIDLLRQVAALYEGRMSDKARALERYRQAFELAPGDEQAQTDVERAAAATKDWQALVDAYSQAIETCADNGDSAAVTTLRLRLGRVLVEEVGEIDAGLQQFRAVVDAEPDNAMALEALESLYQQTERYKDLLEVYTRRSELAQDPESRKQILFGIAALHEEQLHDAASAVATYRAVLEEDAVDQVALEALDRLYQQTEDWEPYAEVLRRRIELDASETGLIDLKFRLANVEQHHLSNPAVALENYREILFLNPDHEGARLALEGMLENEELGGEVASILESIYEARGEWEKLAQALEILVASTEDRERQVELLRRAAMTYAMQLEDLERAFDAQARALKVNPALPEVRFEVEKFAEQAELWDQLTVLYNEVAEGVSDAELAREYWLRLAEIQERLGKVVEAAHSFEKLLELNPMDTDALRAMDALYRGAERWDDLVGVFRRRIELVQDETEREALYAQMAEVFEHQLGRPEEAIAAYRDVLTLDPTSRVALSALDGLYTRQQKWVELAENLDVRLSLAESEEEQIELMLRLASLRESEMGEVEAAIEGYRQVLERDPMNQQAVGSMQRLGNNPDYELVVAEILEPLYRHQGDYERLIAVHEVQVRRADDPHRAVELLHQVATLYEDAAGDLNAAFDTYARALAISQSDEGTREGLDRLARATGRFHDLAQVFQELAEQQEDAEYGSQLYMLAARVVEADVGDVERAIELYQKVLQIDPLNLDAAEALQVLFQNTERYADMSVVLQRKAQILEDLEDQKAALYQAAMLEEELLDRQDAAIAVYKKVLEVDPEDLKTIDALINLYLRAERWEELLEVHTRKADLIIDPEEKKVIYYQVGAIYERELDNVHKAIDTYQRVLELDPDDLTALGRLDVLYQTAQNWPELLSILTHEAELTADPAEAISYQYRIAELYEKYLDDVPRAVELYRDILNIQTDHAPTLQALEGIKNGAAEPLLAAGVLEPVYDAMAEHEKLISVLEVQVRAAEDPFQQIELLHRIARLYEEALLDHGQAFETYARAVTVDSQNEEALGSLERLAMITERWPVVAQLYDAELEKLSEEPHRIVELGLRVAQLYEVQLEDIDNAVARYRQVLEVEPENQNAVRALDRLFTQTERWGDLIEVLVREAEIGESPDEVLDFKFRLGRVYQQQLEDIDRAIEAYGEVINAAPEHEATRQALEDLFERGVKQVEIGEILEPLYQSSGEFEKLVTIHEAQLQHVQEPEMRLSLYYRIAEDLEERLLEPARAFEAYSRALAEQPLDERSGEELERLAGMIDGGWEALANEYANAMEQSEVPVQAALGRRLARVFEEELADVDKAEEAYRYVLSIVPGEPEALANLDRIYTSLEQYAELANILEQRVKAAEDEHEKVELCRRLGQVYEEHLGQVEDAIRAYRMIFDELEPNDEDAINALARIYEEAEAWNELGAVYKRQLENAVGDVEEAEIRAKMARLSSDRLGNIEEAIEGWKRVLDLRGEDPEALNALGELYEKQERWAELSDVLERHFDIAEEDEDRVLALTRRARLFTHPLGRDDEALETWQRVLDIDFSNLMALRAIADIWRRREDANEVVAALHAIVDRAAAMLEGEELREVYRELGQTYGNVLEQTFDAADAWTHLLEVDPTDFEALDELEKIYRVDERWPDVVNVKMQRADAFEDPAEKIRELLEVTEIWKVQVDDYDSATPAFEKILVVDPSNETAFTELERLHTAAERWESLIELYLNRLETLEDVDDRNDLLRRIARVFDEKLDDKDQAFDALVNAFSENFGDLETVRYLERIAQATERWGELLNTANTWLQEQTDKRAKIQLCLRLGKWYGEDLGHPEYAQPYYAQVTQLDPNNAQVLRQMANIYGMRADWQQMGATLYRALEVAVANEDRKTILVDLGELCTKHLGQHDQGVNYYRRALEVDDHYLPALTALERIYGEQGSHAELASILNAKVDALKDAQEIVQAKLKLGELYEQKLNNLDKAAAVFADVIEVDPANLPGLRGLERVFETLQRWGELVGVLEKELDVVETERERVDALLKIANIQEEQFLKADVAAQRLEQALEIDPSELRAYSALERCYRRLKQWLDLVSTYERHISEASEQADKIELYSQIAQVYADEVSDVDQAIMAYQNIVDLDDTNVPALEALARLFEKQEDYSASIDSMTRVADLTTDGNQRVEMYYRIGTALEERLGDRSLARERFEMALDLDPAHLPTLAALRTIFVDEADWDSAARYLELEQENTEAPRAKAKLLVELGKIRDEMLNEHEAAINAYELAIQSDPECEDAALPLVEEYCQAERWADAEPLAEMLVRKSKNRERHEQHMLHNLLGKVEAALQNNEKALKAYQVAHQLDVTDQVAIRGIAEVSYRLKDWPSALTNYQKVLTALSEDEIDARTDVYYRLGCIKVEQGQAKQAINNFEKALGLNPDHRATLDALVDIYERNNDYRQVAAYKRQILDGVFDEDERYQLLREIGDVWSEKQKEPNKAIEALEEARDLRPTDHVLLHKLLQMYQTVGDWQNMVDTVQAIADLENAPDKKARYFYTMAQLYRDKLEDRDRAIELFNEALDLNSDLLDAFERIAKILTQERNWKQLERQYRKMLHRIAGKGNQDLEFNLWHQLGLIYRDRIASPDPAIEAFKMAASLKPGKSEEHVILSELYASTERFDEAIAEQRIVLEQDPLNVEAFRALYNFFLHKRTYDEAWCVASVISFLNKANEQEKQFFEDYRPQGMLAVKGRLSNEQWLQHVFHKNQNLYVSKIFEAIRRAALQAKIAQQNRPITPSNKYKQDPATSTITFAKTFGWAAQVLGVSTPELYVRNDQAIWVVPVPTQPEASLAGQMVLSGFQPHELAFICGKHLAGYRGEQYIRNLFPTQAELTIMLFAGVMIAAPSTPMPQDMAPQIRTTAQALSRFMQPVELEALRQVVKRFIAEGAKANIKRWNQAAEHTATRAGFIVCGDLDVAKKVLSAEQTTPGDLSPAEKIKELLLYAVSSDYFAVRRALGIQLEIG